MGQDEPENTKEETNELPSAEEFLYDQLRLDVWNERFKIKLNGEYFRFLAARRQTYIRFTNFLALLASSSAILAVFAQYKWLAGALALIASIGAFLSLVCNWNEEKVKFLEAKSRLDGLEWAYDRLWRHINTYMFDDIKDIETEFERLLVKDTKINDFIGAHYGGAMFKRRRRKKIQDFLEKSMGLKPKQRRQANDQKGTTTDQG